MTLVLLLDGEALPKYLALDLAIIVCLLHHSIVFLLSYSMLFRAKFNNAMIRSRCLFRKTEQTNKQIHVRVVMKAHCSDTSYD